MYTEMKRYRNVAGQMTKMTTTSISGKNLLTQNQWTDFHETWYVALDTRIMIVCSNDNPGLTLTCFTTMSSCVTYAFLYEKVKRIDFSETISTCDLKDGICIQLID